MVITAKVKETFNQLGYVKQDFTVLKEKISKTLLKELVKKEIIAQKAQLHRFHAVKDFIINKDNKLSVLYALLEIIAKEVFKTLSYVLKVIIVPMELDLTKNIPV